MELSGPLVLVLQGWDTLGGDEEEGPEGRVLHVGRFSLSHFNQHDAQRPDVHLGAYRRKKSEWERRVYTPQTAYRNRGHESAQEPSLATLKEKQNTGSVPACKDTIGSTNHGVSDLLLVGELGSISKVGELDSPIRGEKDVVTLDISVDSVQRVHVGEGLQCFSGDISANVIMVII